MGQWIAVAVGGALGAVARFGVTGLMQRFVPGAFPAATLTVNIVGGFLVGLVTGLLAGRSGPGAHEVRVFLIAGVCGGFTTFSAFTLETMRLLETGATAAAVMNVLAQVVGALVATMCGLWLGRQW